MFDFSIVSKDDWALLYALALFGSPLKQTNLSALMQQRGEKLQNERPYDNAAVQAGLTRLTAAQVVRFDVGAGYALDSVFQAEVLLALQKSGEFKSWVASVRSLLSRLGEYSHWKPQNAAFCRREMLFSAYLGDELGFRQWREQFYNVQKKGQSTVGDLLFKDSQNVALLRLIPEEIQALILLDIFYPATWGLLDCRLAYAYALEHAPALLRASPGLLDSLCWQAFLRADFEKLAYFRHEYKGEAFGRSQLPVFLCEKIVRGDIDHAYLGFEDLIKSQKAAHGKRKFFVPDQLGLFYTVLLLAKNLPASLKKAKEQIDDGVKNHYAYAYFMLQPMANHLVKGVPLLAPPEIPLSATDLELVFSSLAHYWQDLPSTPQRRAYLIEARKNFETLGYVWPAVEIDHILTLQYDTPSLFPNWYAEHGVKPLAQALLREETWQRALAALAQLKPEAMNQVSPGADQRIAWLLLDHPHLIQLEPREQKLGAKGGWSKGRPVSLKRMAHEQDSLPAMTEQDKRLATCIRKTYDGYYGGSEYEINGEKALPYLVGHPAVYWIDAPDVRIDIAKGEVALLLKEKGDLISMSLDPVIGTGNSVLWRKETPTKLTVYSASAELKQIAGILGAGLTVPVTAKAQLVDVIAAIAPHLAIHSDLPELAAHIANVEANSIIFAHCLPLQEGLRVQMLVRPLLEGSWYPPGKGAANVLGEQQGKAVQASRDLKAEAKRLKTIVEACPAFAEAEEKTQEWELTDPEQCLELLSQLRMIPEETLQLVWPEGERFRLRANRSLAQMRLTIKKQGEWFVAGGDITLDDGRIFALRELMHLAEGASGRFLKIGENDYLALTASFRKRLDELRSFGEMVGKDGVRINQLAAPVLAEMAAEVGDLQADSEWRAQMQKLDALAEFTPQLPTTLQAELRDYQLLGYQWLARLAHWGVGACLADDMGLGKTVQTLALLLDRAPHGPALVVAPISVAMNWQAEVARFAPTLKVRAYNAERSLADLGAFDIVIASYGMLQSDAEQFAAQHWHSVVLDEAQVIKNSATKRSQAAMALTADFKMIASGTPVENHLGELWNLFRFINPGLLGSKERFAERYSNPIERGDKQARAHLKKLIQPFILRRTKTQVLSELPSRTEINLQVLLSDEERHLYEALRQEAMDKIAHMDPADGKAMQVLAEITKLRRFCCNPKLVLKNTTVSGSKLAVFAETVEELLDNRHKALVFSQFVDHLAIVRAWLDEKGISYQYLDGSTPALERKKRVDAFQAGDGDIFLISLKAGGTGLNLTAADYVIHLDPWWNPAVEDQASDRAHRMGQLRPVTIYRLVTQDTIEEKILALHGEKRDLADSLLDGGDAAGKLDTTALLRLLRDAS